MSKLVVVSNRLPSLPEKDSPRSRKENVGGLVSALISALELSGGGVWFGWSGKSSPGEKKKNASWSFGSTQIVGFDLTRREINSYYNGFCNRALWPLLHGFQSEVQLHRQENLAYNLVNARFAQELLPYLEKNDSVWVNDYHLFLLGRELRRLGHEGPIGFFLHIPFPSYVTWQILPEPEEVLDGMMDFDLVGLHTRTYRDNYVYTSQRLIDSSWDGKYLRASGRRQRVHMIPIGVDPERFGPGDAKTPAGRRRRGLQEEAGNAQIILGVDRLDYTKGIPQRILSFEALLQHHPEYRSKVCMFQICAPSRSEVPEYINQKKSVESIVGRINGEFAEHDWVPIRYFYRSYPHDRLSVFYREAHACLVTPLRDGMNLVAKEYIAAQDPEDPGVLVLSKFTGAAEDLTEAVIVNPYLPEDVADGIARALSMPLQERVERHEILLEKVVRHSAEWWFKTFLKELGETSPD
ncbi:MAG: trehalose-6-phosphate synthase [Nitrospinae bacterium]|nr:trehalose-6-phosphate synthase [Nitrospinota bacterium]